MAILRKAKEISQIIAVMKVAHRLVVLRMLDEVQVSEPAQVRLMLPVPFVEDGAVLIAIQGSQQVELGPAFRLSQIFASISAFRFCRKGMTSVRRSDRFDLRNAAHKSLRIRYSGERDP